MPVARQIHLNLFIHGAGHHEAAWRLPESNPFANTDAGHFANLARIAEAGIVPVLGSTEAEAKARDREFEERINPEYGLVQLSRFFNMDLTGLDLDTPLPRVPVEDEIEDHKSRTTLIVNLARSEYLTVRELLAKLGGGRGHRTFSGTPEQLADTLELWFRNGAADGFNIMPAAMPGDLQTFVDAVIPLLQRRGLFRADYAGSTLRQHYGLSRPRNRLAPELATQAA